MWVALGTQVAEYSHTWDGLRMFGPSVEDAVYELFRLIH